MQNIKNIVEKIARKEGFNQKKRDFSNFFVIIYAVVQNFFPNNFWILLFFIAVWILTLLFYIQKQAQSLLYSNGIIEKALDKSQEISIILNQFKDCPTRDLIIVRNVLHQSIDRRTIIVNAFFGLIKQGGFLTVFIACLVFLMIFGDHMGMEKTILLLGVLVAILLALFKSLSLDPWFYRERIEDQLLLYLSTEIALRTDAGNHPTDRPKRSPP